MSFQARVTRLRELLLEDGIEASWTECANLLLLDTLANMPRSNTAEETAMKVLDTVSA